MAKQTNVLSGRYENMIVLTTHLQDTTKVAKWRTTPPSISSISKNTRSIAVAIVHAVTEKHEPALRVQWGLEVWAPQVKSCIINVQKEAEERWKKSPQKTCCDWQHGQYKVFTLGGSNSGICRSHYFFFRYL